MSAEPQLSSEDKTNIELHCTWATYDTHREFFDNHFAPPGDPNVDPHAELVSEEADYGIVPHLDRMATAGLVFYGFHDNGRSYPQRVFASDGTDNTLHWAYTIILNGPPVVAVQDNGQPDRVGLDRIRDYQTARTNAERDVPTSVTP
jgi:hypothetical protein